MSFKASFSWVLKMMPQSVYRSEVKSRLHKYNIIITCWYSVNCAEVCVKTSDWSYESIVKVSRNDECRLDACWKCWKCLPRFFCLFAFHSLHKLLAKELGTGDIWTFWPIADANSKYFSLFCKRNKETKKSKPVCIFYERLVVTELTNIACRSVNAVFYLPISVHDTNKICISYSMRTLQGTDVCICAAIL